MPRGPFGPFSLLRILCILCCLPLYSAHQLLPQNASYEHSDRANALPCCLRGSLSYLPEALCHTQNIFVPFFKNPFNQKLLSLIIYLFYYRNLLFQLYLSQFYHICSPSIKYRRSSSSKGLVATNKSSPLRTPSPAISITRPRAR